MKPMQWKKKKAFQTSLISLITMKTIILLILLPHKSQEMAQESDFSPQAATAKLKFHNYRNEIPASLRKPYRDPRINKTGILQPSFKTPPKNRVNPIITEITPNTSHKANTETPQINKDNGIATENSNSKAPTHDLFNLKFKSTKIYVSPYLEDEYKPNPESFKLTPDLAPLLPLIMSQHEVFAQHIIDLSKTNLTLTKVIEKKKESFIQLENNKKSSHQSGTHNIPNLYYKSRLYPTKRKTTN